MKNKVTQYNELLSNVNQYIFQKSKETSEDPYHLEYHFRPLTGWINDPNGLIHYKGEYHLFYQYHPFSAVRGPMHWGHAKSKDLITWQHLPIALAPFEKYEKDGCYSGSAVDQNGRLTVVYTGHVKENGRRKEVQCLAQSKDGVTFSKYEKNPIIPTKPQGVSEDFRDPKVWKHENLWYMVVGSSKEGKGVALLYCSSNLNEWTYKGIVAESNGEQGYMWECPDLFPLGNKHVLIVSPKGMESGKNIYLIGDMDYEQGKFTPEYYDEIDNGFDFYAAQTFLDGKNRRIIIGWMGIWSDANLPTKDHGWAGAMTLPREMILLPDGKVAIQPVTEYQKLRNHHHHLEDLTISPESYGMLEAVKGDCIEIIAVFDLELCDAIEFGVKVRCSSDLTEETNVIYNMFSKELLVDREKSGIGKGGVSRADLKFDRGSKLKIHIFIDRSSIEIFGNDGRVNLSNRIYPKSTSLGLDLFSKGGSVKADSIDIWRLR